MVEQWTAGKYTMLQWDKDTNTMIQWDQVWTKNQDYTSLCS